MTVKHENRVRKFIRQDIDRQLQEAEGRPIMRLQNEIIRLREELEQEGERVKELINLSNRFQLELDNAEKRHQLDLARAQKELEEAQKTTEHFRTLWKFEHEKASAKERAHKKASAILRLLPPERYHQMREDAADLYPELFKDEQ